VSLLALLLGAGVTYFILKEKIVSLTADGSPITVSGDTIHIGHKKIARTNNGASAHHGKNQPVSLTMFGCAPPNNCAVNLMPNWSAVLYGATVNNGQVTGETQVDVFTDVPDPSGADNTVTIQPNLPLNDANGGFDQGGPDFYVSRIVVTSGGQPTPLSCSTLGLTCYVAIDYCPAGKPHPVPGTAQCNP
jgi:hypothetical protein